MLQNRADWPNVPAKIRLKRKEAVPRKRDGL